VRKHRILGFVVGLLRVYYYKCLGSLVGLASSLVAFGTSDGPDRFDDLSP